VRHRSSKSRSFSVLGLTIAAGLFTCSSFGCGDGAGPPTADALDVADATPAPGPRLGTVTVFAGDSDRGHTDGLGQGARFQGVTALCQRDGAVYVSDTFAGTIRKVQLATGLTTTVAGAAGRLALSDGAAGDARFASPRGLACLDDGLLVADSGALRKVGFDGTTTTIAGFPGTAGNVDGAASEARIGYLVHAMATRADGRVLFSDRSNDSLRQVDLATGTVTTLVPNLSGPGGIAIDPAAPDVAWVADSFADRIIRVDLETGVVTPLAVVGGTLSTPQGLVVDGGFAWVTSFGADIWQIDLATGDAQRASRNFGGAFGSPVLVAGEGGPAFIYAELERSALRRFDFGTSADTPIAGSVQPAGFIDGPREVARFGLLSGIAVSGTTIFVTDEHGLRRVRADRFAADSPAEVDTLRTTGSVRLDAPEGLAVDEDTGTLWVSEPARGLVWALDLASAETTTAPTVIAQIELLGQPAGITIGPAGPLVAQRGGHRIARWDGAAFVPFAGDGIRGSRDGPLSEARFDEPHALAFDSDTKRLWVVELGGRLRLVDLATGLVSTVLTPGDAPTDGPLMAARLSFAMGVLVAGDVFIFDADPGSVRRLTFQDGAPDALETVVGARGLGGGMPPGATFPLSEAIVGSAAGGVRVGDQLLVIAEHAIYLVDLGDAFDRPDEPPLPTPADCDFALVIGTGASGFEALPESLVLERGTQGLQHIYVSVETNAANLPDGLHPVTLTLTTGADATPRARMSLTVPWTGVGDLRTVAGMVFVIEDPSLLVDVPATLTASVGYGAETGCAAAPVILSW